MNTRNLPKTRGGATSEELLEIRDVLEDRDVALRELAMRLEARRAAAIDARGVDPHRVDRALVPEEKRGLGVEPREAKFRDRVGPALGGPELVRRRGRASARRSPCARRRTVREHREREALAGRPAAARGGISSPDSGSSSSGSPGAARACTSTPWSPTAERALVGLLWDRERAARMGDPDWRRAREQFGYARFRADLLAALELG